MIDIPLNDFMERPACAKILEFGGVSHKLHDVSMKEIIGVGPEDNDMIRLKLFCIEQFSGIIDPNNVFRRIKSRMICPVFWIQEKQDPEIFE